MGKQYHAWEARLTREGLPATIGEEADRMGTHGDRVLSLDVHPHLTERVSGLVTWDTYAWDQDETEAASLLAVPDEIRLIGEKRAQHERLTDAERQMLHRFRQGAHIGHPGRPRKS